MISKTPTYNLKVVVQDTGLKPDTLRAWERRYGLPDPQRTDGGHRLYSEYDIETIKWLLTRQEEGLSISRAVDLWVHLLDEGKDPFRENPIGVPGGQGVLDLSAGENLNSLRRFWLDACRDFNETVAEQVLTQSFALYPAEMVVLEVLQKGLAEIGEEWYNGEISVQQEHFTSALALRRLDALVGAAPRPSRNGKVLVACPPNEDHVFSALVMTLFLRYRGWDVVYLGANVPLSEMKQTVEKVRPSLVILIAMQLRTAASTLDMVNLLQQERVPVAFGGLAFNRIPELRERIPAHFMGETLPEAVENAVQILVHGVKERRVKEAPRAIRRALTEYRSRISRIEAEIWEAMLPMGLQPKHLSVANLHLSQDILAALELGGMEYLGSEVAWIETYLANMQLPPSLLPQYIERYIHVLKSNLQEDAKPILDWLTAVYEQLPLSEQVGA